LIGEENAIAGSAAATAMATIDTVREIGKIALIGVAFVLFVLLVTTLSWIEPFVVLCGLGVAIVINSGSNLIFGEISFVSNAAGNILQLAVSLDYSVFLLHRFVECRKEIPDVREAMTDALVKSTSSILSSGLTTVIGFAALCLMRFGIGPDLGLVLAKGIAISLVTVFVFSPALILCTYKLIDKTRHRPFTPGFRGFGKLVGKLMLPMACVFALLVAPACLASTKNDFHYGAAHIFGPETRLGADAGAIEDVFGKSDTYVLMAPRGAVSDEQRLSTELQTLPQISGVVSYADDVGAEIPPEYLDERLLSRLVSGRFSRMAVTADVDFEGGETFDLIENIRGIAGEYYPDAYHLAGEGVSTYDLMDTVTSDMDKVNRIAVGAVFLVLLFAMKSISLPVILVLGIETAVWINMSIPYFTGTPIFYIAYLIISSVQLGATVDYAILFTDRYNEYRARLDRKAAVVETVSSVTLSILTSGVTLTAVGFLLGAYSTHGLLSQLGYFLGRGTLCSLAVVLFVLPGLLYLFDGIIRRSSFDFLKARQGRECGANRSK
jgi:predicted RND superfamily exporter protein